MSFHRMKLVCFVGGTNVNRDLNQLRSGAPDILVATPGRCVMLVFRMKSAELEGNGLEEYQSSYNRNSCAR